jgi:hypothetical protein
MFVNYILVAALSHLSDTASRLSVTVSHLFITLPQMVMNDSRLSAALSHFTAISLQLFTASLQNASGRSRSSSDCPHLSATFSLISSKYPQLSMAFPRLNETDPGIKMERMHVSMITKQRSSAIILKPTTSLPGHLVVSRQPKDCFLCSLFNFKTVTESLQRLNYHIGKNKSIGKKY